MDLSTLKTLLDSQTQAYKNSLEVIVKQVNVSVSLLQSKVNDLTTSLEFTQNEMEDLKKEIQQHKQEKKTNSTTIKKLCEDIQSRDDCIKSLEERLNYQEDYSRRNNLQIIGVEESPDEDTWEKTAVKVNKILEEKLQLPGMQLERAHRVGQRNDHRHRPIVARFTRFADREAVMRNVTKLRGTRIYINEDLCPASQAIRREQLPMLKKAKSEGKVAYFRHTKLIIKERTRINEASRVVNTGRVSASGDAGIGGTSTHTAGNAGASALGERVDEASAPDGGNGTSAPGEGVRGASLSSGCVDGGASARSGALSRPAAAVVTSSESEVAGDGGASAVVEISAAGVWMPSPRVKPGVGRGVAGVKSQSASSGGSPQQRQTRGSSHNKQRKGL